MGEAVCRVERSDHDFNLAVPLSGRPDPARANETRERIVTCSRERYATPRVEVEALLAAKFKAGITQEPPKPEDQSRSQPVGAKQHVQEASKDSQPELSPSTVESLIGLPEPHLAIQERIRICAEQLGFEARLEEVILGGQGRADILLKKAGRVIVCEITVTTTIEQEVSKITRYVKGEFQHIAIVSSNPEKLRLIEQGAGENAKLGFYSPEEFCAQLRIWAAEDVVPEKSDRARPRKPNVTFWSSGLSEEARRAKEVTMLSQLATAMKTGKGL